MKILTFVIAFLFIQHNIVGQDTFPKDTTTFAQETNVKQDPYGMFSMFKGNPGRAALYSLILPGAGQYYNKRFWKVPVVVGAEAAAIYFLIRRTRTYREWDDCWKGLVNETGCNGFDVSQTSTVKGIRDQARSNRDNQWLILIGVHLIITADAFIDRHLIEFDVSDDLSICLLYTSPSPRDRQKSRMPSSA